MKKIRMLSFNVNGIRAIHNKGFDDWFKAEKPGILCLQEIKAEESQFPEELRNPEGYSLFTSSSKTRKGYSGVAIYSSEKPDKVEYGFGIEKFDAEGRTLIAHFDKFVLYNIYFPNGGDNKIRLDFKMDFYYSFLEHLKSQDKKKKIIICGDVNTAHKEIDLARPKQNENNTGFLPEERKWIDDLVDAGFIDTFRLFNSDGGNYSWWDYKTAARSRNVGWRIDYFFISENLKTNLKEAFILPEVQGSDHCPVGIILEI